MVNDEIIELIKAFYADLSVDSLSMLPDIYDVNIIFQDPVQKVEGLDALKSYFQHGLANAKRCTFDIQETTVVKNTVFLVWTMTLEHPKLNGGKFFSIDGTSRLITNDNGTKVVFHRDYFDLGAMLYEQIPIVSSVIRAIKKRAKL
ncbi:MULTISPECIES: nuclear transport factor 2 family protein [Gammaproteobacteria]|uniref:nuclear transport factor 2 family protein n=1 Tax=Gammaproteobacteria TaxID=1236 RepID=UPI000DD06AB8|nr:MULTISPECIES: nuclear transport factor 2 family protein [Gammaproteobacteria]RTE87322.1 nuclear transport factor 2 family protein [Aliidiomarina sp. B3213]TCZ92892.1 nuclear transport factor 2 family protein [Lysobacter sp. N42]